MFGPKRKLGVKAQRLIDPPVTQKKYDSFVDRLSYLKKVAQPKASKEVMILAEGGDFSENAGYQAAKGRLRSINNKIYDLEQRVKRAKIIKMPVDTFLVQLGHTVTLKINGKENIFTILGSTETDPSKGIISKNSPIGAAIFGRSVGEEIIISVRGKDLRCRIIKISV